MKIDAGFLAGHLEYTRWASLKTIGAARALTPSELNQHMYNSFGGVLGTLHHIFFADRVWLSRLEGNPLPGLSSPGEAYTIEELQRLWQDVLARLIAYAANLTDEGVASVLRYRNLRGINAALPVWQVILHLVNHGTYHRGQITTMLRQLGHECVSTDLNAYYLEMQAKAAGFQSGR
jgi:uncharacterized damage-inducible protein DinB